MATILLSQHQTAVANPGDRVCNIVITSCALVLGFYNTGQVACYHWYGFINIDNSFDTFDKLLYGTPVTVSVVTHEPTQIIQSYQQTFQLIYERYNRRVPINYYITNRPFNSDIIVDLGVDDLIPIPGNDLSLAARYEAGQDYAWQ